MIMASEILCVNSQKGNKLCGGNKVHDQIDHVECQSSFSSLYACHKKTAPEGINGTSYSEGCNSKPTKPDIVSEITTDNAVSTLSGAVNSDGNAFLHDKHGRIEASLEAQPQQCSRQQTGCTLQDLYMQDHYDDEEDDDSDWEPANVIVIKRWFCTNCTMPNYDENYHCEGCGERKDSEISPHDNSLAQASNDSDAAPRYQDSSSKICTAIGFDERMLLHSEVERKSLPHPERPDRLRAIASKLATAGLIPGKCSLIPAREITQEELQMVHSMDHIEAVQQTSCSRSSYFTPDTYANEHSACAARIAAGLCSDLAFSIMSGRSRNGFALVRPPGHHAGVKQSMGFCLHNNAAIAALAAQRAGAKKVLILDWDVHHGNGTQEIFEGNKSVLYVSLHRHEEGRFYPGTGAADEVGIMDAKGYSVNIPWSCGGVGDNDYIFAFQHIVLPIATDFAPDITIISAGFDAARGDPLGCCDVTPAGFAQMTHMLTALSQGKLLVVLEGGYNLRSISSSAVAVVKVLLGEDPKFEMSNLMPSRAGLKTTLQVMKIHSKFWPVLKPSYLVLRSQRESFSSNKRDHVKKRKRLVGPFWWKLGSKRLMYELVYGLHSSRGRRHAKRVC